jgi:uncharacterized membrane protein YdjX (TVP38/TMEM64 family)
MTEPPHNSPVTPGIARRLGPAGLLALAWAAAPALMGILLLANIGPVRDWLDAHRAAGVYVYTFLFMFSAGFGVLPTYAQSILGGWVFGFALGFPAALAGFTGGALIGYVVAHTVAKTRVERMIDEKVKARAVRDALIGRGFWSTLGVVALLRLSPNSPFALMNLAMAATGVPRLPYAVGTLLGMAPRTGLTVFLAATASATGAKDIGGFIREGPGKWVLIGGALLLILALAVLGYIGNKAVERVTRGTPRTGSDPGTNESSNPR